MLNAHPTRARRRIAAVCMPIALVGVSVSAWSATPSAMNGKPEYQLEAHIAASEGNDANVTLCTRENEAATISPAPADGAPGWLIHFTVNPAPQPGLLDVTIDSVSDRDHHRVTSRQILRGKPNEAMTVRFGNGADSGLRSIQIIPAHGCPAASKAHA